VKESRLDLLLGPDAPGWTNSDIKYLKEIARVSRETRAAQKAFYAAPSGSPERNAALVESKKRERQLDSLLSESVPTPTLL
jgi:hypothetical protein